MTTSTRIPVVDLARRAAALEPELSEAIERVVRSGRYLLGPETEAFETEFAAFGGRRHAVAVASGTEALRLALVALGVGPGDEVIVPAFTAVPTAAAVCATGAVPVFVDVDPTPPRSTRPAARGRGHRADPGRDPGAPLRPAGADSPTSASRCSRTPPRRTARSTPRPGRPRRRTASTRRRTSAGSATAARWSPTTTISRRDRAAPAGARAHRRLRARRGLQATPGCPRSKRRRCASGCARLAAQNARRRAIARPLPRGRAGDALAGAARARTSTTCASRGSTTATRSGARMPFDTGVHYPRALTQQPAYRQFVAASRARRPKRGRPSACRYPASPR